MRGSVNAVRIRAPQIGGERFGETGVITELGMLAPWSLRLQVEGPDSSPSSAWGFLGGVIFLSCFVRVSSGV